MLHTLPPVSIWGKNFDLSHWTVTDYPEQILQTSLSSSLFSHKPSDNSQPGLQLLQRLGDSDVGFGIWGHFIQGHSCRWHRCIPELHVQLHQLPDHHAQMWRELPRHSHGSVWRLWKHLQHHSLVWNRWGSHVLVWGQQTHIICPSFPFSPFSFFPFVISPFCICTYFPHVHLLILPHVSLAVTHTHASGHTVSACQRHSISRSCGTCLGCVPLCPVLFSHAELWNTPSQ